MAGSGEPLELVTVGRSSVDLYGEQVGGRLEAMGSFAKYVGGSPTNTAIGAARLGVRAALVTRVGADHFGRFINEELSAEGVDVSGVRADPARLTALAILGIRDRTQFPLLFYRENCADMALSVADLDEAWLEGAGAVLINGTHLSQAGVSDASMAAARAVKRGGGRVVFDIDYRPVLWGLAGRDMGEDRFVADASVTARLQTVLPLCDLIVGTEEEIHILGGCVDTVAALRTIRASTDALLVCKLGPGGCAAFPGDIPDRIGPDGIVPGFPVEVYNVLGAGDAFMAGFLRGWLRGEPVETCCRWGNACGALVVSRHGCAPAMPTWVELRSFLDLKVLPHRLRDDAALEHVHWASTRRGRFDELTILAFDHRFQFEELARTAGSEPDRISRFKELALRAVQQLERTETSLGVLIDGRFGFDALALAANTSYWIGRPIEVPRSRPLDFEGAADVATELATWPLNHVVKCLVLYHPDDAEELRGRQERQLLRLFEACRKTRHELLLELILPPGMAADHDTVAAAIRRIYALGIRPDWWKLEPFTDVRTWTGATRAIEENDPYCRGVVILGLSAPEAELLASFEVAARFPVVKGFAIGRTIFADVARRWFAGALDDAAAVDAMTSRFAFLINGWRRARGLALDAA
jgi:5-dehydro-2-deoxygluconokinase